MELSGATEIARRSRGTPRVCNRLLRRVRDYAQVYGDNQITKDVANKALALFEIDEKGLEDLDRKILQTIVQVFQGGPVGLDTLAASIGEEAGTLEDVYEPYLMQLGLLQRTARGRMATTWTYRYLGLPSPKE